MPAAPAAALRALSSWPIKSKAGSIRPLHHPAAEGRKRGLSGPFWLDIFMEEVWLVRFPGPGTPAYPPLQLHDEQTHHSSKALHQAHV